MLIQQFQGSLNKITKDLHCLFGQHCTRLFAFKEKILVLYSSKPTTCYNKAQRMSKVDFIPRITPNLWTTSLSILLHCLVTHFATNLSKQLYYLYWLVKEQSTSFRSVYSFYLAFGSTSPRALQIQPGCVPAIDDSPKHSAYLCLRPS